MINLGLSRITALLRPLLSTHDPLPWRAVHIAGTNGKGSVASYVSTFLAHQGFKVGRFTSPHLVNRWDCISLNSRTVDKTIFLEVESELKSRSVEEGINASEFEILTAVAFELFTRHGVDYGVVECGLGGRLDATNALRPQDVAVSVLAKVGLDHTEFLGNTVEAVAREKCGIFKRDGLVVVDESNEDSVKSVVRERLQDVNGEQGSKLWFKLSPGQAQVIESDRIGKLALADHQKQNLTTAYTAYHAAMQQRAGVSAASPTLNPKVEIAAQDLASLIEQSHASIRGRLERLSLPPHLLPSGSHHRDVQVLIDGAHNPQSATALASYIDTHLRPKFPGQSLTWVISMKQGKEIETILRTLIHQDDNVVTCSFGPVDGMPWVQSLDASLLAEKVREFTSGRVEVAAQDGDVASAIKTAVAIAAGGPLCIAGSLYLVGDVLRLVEEGG